MSNKSIKKSNELKYLQTQRQKLVSQREILKKVTKEKQDELTSLNSKIKNIDERLEKLISGNEIVFSEHAILRYIERVLGINLTDIKAKILTESEKDECMQMGGNLTYKKEDFTVKIQDFVVTTVFKE
ncbi:hypothetical protein [Campylobacter ureolyticus]|jgi:hypothetical protein|uniref:hypothetical protein n=1 Tax=Campylobacter ureolyticus TaxID=827 RepID=UPI0022B5A626|nr:hypothetical protein [Campylobacter ureolyticus]MCZ6117353.1 hypothetical protein [Campylobacter ureolyticus]